MADKGIDQLILEALFRVGGLAVAVVDAEKRYVRVTDEFAALNGISADAHIGHTPREVIPKIADAVESVLDHVLQTKLPLTDLEVAPPEGGPSVRVSLYPLIDDATAVGVLAIAKPDHL